MAVVTEDTPSPAAPPPDDTPEILPRLRHWVSDNAPPLGTIISGAVLAIAVLFVFVQLQPRLLFANTTPAGGDMGAHVWGPAYLRDHLLHHFRLTGWAPDWYAGFPALHFYFPLPSLLIVVLNAVLPYNIAFKLVTVLGILTLPVAAWFFARSAGLRYPGPIVVGLSTLLFLFDRSFTIYGGNIPSTLAGEFSFSISLSLALVFLGLIARGLDDGRRTGLAAAVLAATGLCHLLPTVFAVVAAIVLLALRPGVRQAKFVGAALTAGALIAAFWSFPFLMRLPYANDMGWEKIAKIDEQVKGLFPHSIYWIAALAAVGAAISYTRWVQAVALDGTGGETAREHRAGMMLTIVGLFSGALFVFAPPHRLWNARVLPFWYLCLYFLAAIAVAEVARGLAVLVSADPHRPNVWWRHGTAIVTLVAVLVIVGRPLHALHLVAQPKDSSFIPGWVKWNYSGYERKPAYPQYRDVIATMQRVGERQGCGRAMWEYESELDRYGTPLAMMLLPYWTDGCIASMEGLYFESSATTPYHFLDAAYLSAKPSNPQRGLPYPSLNIADGVRRLQLLGVRYYMAFSRAAVTQADVDRDLTLIDQSNAFDVTHTVDGKSVTEPFRWRIYQVAGSDIVAGLDVLPSVLRHAPKGGKAWQDLAVAHYVDNAHFDQPIVASGPAEWPRVDSMSAAPTVPVASPATVSNIRTTDDRISFDVDNPGSPVIVKASYFPNWHASGAKGPYRLAPNLMVVVPTSTHVSLHYGWTPVDAAGWMATLIGVAGALWLTRREPFRADRFELGAGEQLDLFAGASVAPEHDAQPAEPDQRANDPPDDR
ncbi:MAG: hypothetical protein JWO37_2426 [Acidimicrobiales bacterium]|jgi:hypothetical protein|nr:hypothetical protein [Acidimicrobiales bacterium]